MKALVTLLMRAPYQIATIHPDDVPEYEPHPNEPPIKRFAGLVRVHSRVWRALDGQATIKLTTINHPRPLRADLADSITRVVQELVWAQRFQVVSSTSLQLPIGGKTARAAIHNLHAGATTSGLIANLPPIERALPKPPAHLPGLPRLPLQAASLPDTIDTLPSLVLARDLTLITALWHTKCWGLLQLAERGCYNTHLYTAIAGPTRQEQVVDKVPHLIQYA